ncbi:MAG: RHS repeat-associated core domain-containing protein, partial [Candidatus Thiodiazotropha sp.]
EGAQGIVRYTYDDGSVLLQTDDTGATLAKYDYGPDRLLSLEQVTEGEQFYHFDALGSVVNLSRPDGSLQARYQYDAWGNERASTGSSWNRFAFTGHEKDEETGLYYFKARFYDPQVGRFISQDAYLGEANTAPSLHRYLYAYANPTVYIDLTGYEAEAPCTRAGCSDERTVEEQAQYEAVREAERDALLNKKSDVDPSKQTKPQSGPKGSDTVVEDEQGLGSKVEGLVDWFNEKREQLKEKVTERIVALFDETRRNKLEKYYKGRGGDSPEIAAQKAEEGASAAAANSKEEARKFVDSAEEMAAGGAIGKSVGTALGVVAATGKRVAKGPLWTTTKNKSAAQNAYRHFKDHGAEFGAKNAVDYAKQAQQFLRNPPKGTLSRTRANGDIVRYHPKTNTFGVMDKTGAPRTMFKPDRKVHGYKSNLDYFNAQ